MCNEGVLDRMIRIAVGLALLTLVFGEPPVMWGWLGLGPLLTGIAGVCPAYTLLGVTTQGPVRPRRP